MGIKAFLVIILSFPLFCHAQKVERIIVNLYTDSLKKGTYNYINIDGELSNHKYLPLDTATLIFWASDGKFIGNSLWIDRNFNKEKVDIKVTLKENPAVSRSFTLYIKKVPNPDKLKTSDELLDEMKRSRSKTKSKGN